MSFLLGSYLLQSFDILSTSTMFKLCLINSVSMTVLVWNEIFQNYAFKHIVLGYCFFLMISVFFFFFPFVIDKNNYIILI